MNAFAFDTDEFFPRPSPSPPTHGVITGIADSTLYRAPEHTGRVFVTATGGIGMEAEGRLAVKSIDGWIALAWNDPPPRPPAVPYRPGPVMSVHPPPPDPTVTPRTRWEEDR